MIISHHRGIIFIPHLNNKICIIKIFIKSIYIQCTTIEGDTTSHLEQPPALGEAKKKKENKSPATPPKGIRY
jgi:hypothetical protein